MKTTSTIRAVIQKSSASVRAIAARYGINPKTVQKWRKRAYVHDAPMRPAVSRLSREEQAIIVGFRRHMQLPLDDCLHALKATIPQLSRSALHRCLQRHGVRPIRLRRARAPTLKRADNSDGTGHFRIAVAEVRTEEGNACLFMAIDPVSKWLFTQMHTRATRRVAAQFLDALLSDVPYQIHSVLTDDELPFTPAAAARSSACLFGIACRRRLMRHLVRKRSRSSPQRRSTQTHAGTEEIQSPPFHFRTRAEAKQRARSFLAAYRFERRLKSLRGMTPHAFLCTLWSENPRYFRVNPCHYQWDLKELPPVR
jgi:hypothetical protein